MNILWASNYVSNSGYSNQARLFVPRLIADGYDTWVLNLGFSSNRPQTFEDGTRLLPTHFDLIGNDSIPGYVRQYEIDALITLIDTWALRHEATQSAPWFPWVPIDHDPVPPGVEHALQTAVKPLAMSQWGQAKLAEAGINALYVPLAVDPAVWHPRDKYHLRLQNGIAPDTFLAIFVGVNDTASPNRKGIPELLAAWQQFVRDNPNSKLLLHTNERGNIPQRGDDKGVDIPAMLKMLDLQGTVKIVNQHMYRSGFAQEQLADMVAMADVVVSPSAGEGFGLIQIEAQRMGVPTIASDFSAQTELCFSNWLVKGKRVWTWQKAYWQVPCVDSIAAQLRVAQGNRDNPRIREHVIEAAREYDVDNVWAKYWKPALGEIGQHVLDIQAEQYQQRKHRRAVQ